MRDSRNFSRPQRFSFWTKGEFARLAVIGALCWYPFSMSTDETPSLTQRHARPETGATVPAAGRLRALRVTDFDLAKTGPLSLGDTDD